MKINIVLPAFVPGNSVSGGVKTVYQYANYLASTGHDVRLYYNLCGGVNDKHIPKLIMKIIKKGVFYLRRRHYPAWFDLDQQVNQYVATVNNKNVLDADIVIATAFQTVRWVDKLSASKGKKVYLIQGYEKWGEVTEEQLHASYLNDWDKIVVSDWLKERVEKYSPSKCNVIKNGVDKEIFKVNNDIKQRSQYSICSMYSNEHVKGGDDCIYIMNNLVKKYPGLKGYVFGNSKRPNNLDKKIIYLRSIKEEGVADLMNKSAIYVCTSHDEGYGLPGLEAMSCGAALVSMPTRGVFEYAGRKSAVIVKNINREQLFAAIIDLIDNPQKRIIVAEAGVRDTKALTVNNSCRALEKTLTMIARKQ